MKRCLGTSSLLFFIIATGCGDSDSSKQAGDALRPVVLGEHTQVFDKSWADKVTVEPDRLLFPAAGLETLLKKTPGDILVGDKSATNAKNKDGFLRKVKSVSQQGDNIEVITEAATLPEAIKDGKFLAELQVPPLGPTGPLEPASLSSLPTGLRPQGGTKNLLKFDNIVLFDENPSLDVGGKQVGAHIYAKTTKGSVDFTPKFDVGADIGWFELKEFHAIAQGNLNAVVEFDVGLELTSNLDGDTLAKLIAQAITKNPSKVLFDYPVDLGTLSLGPLPLPSSADFKVVLDCEFLWTGGAKVLVGATGDVMLKAGIKYENGEISGVFDKSASLTPTGPTWTLDGAVKVRCDLKPTFELKLFGIATGKIWGDAYAQLNANVECGSGQLTGKVSGEAFAGVRAGASAKVDVFGLYKWQKECTLFDVESPHAQASGTFPLPGGQSGTCSPDPKSLTTPPPANPAMCFGNSGAGGSGGSGIGGSGGSGGSSAGGTAGSAGTGECDAGCDAACTNCDAGDSGQCAKQLVPPDVWSCDPKKYGDCVCDCMCGAPDDDCKVGECNQCSHDECTKGDPLSPTCSSCVKSVCDVDAYCCTQVWDGGCTIDAEDYCGKTCQ